MKSCSEDNEARYQPFCSRKGKIESNQLPPCQHSLRKHIDRANYQARICRKSCEEYAVIREPQNHGWKYDNDQLAIDWMTISPAPESILELFSCGYVKSCDNNRSAHRANGIPCTDMCKLKNCSNSVIIQESDDDNKQNNDSEILWWFWRRWNINKFQSQNCT